MTCSAEHWVLLALALAACDGEMPAVDGGRDAGLAADAGVDAPAPLEPSLAVEDQTLTFSTIITVDGLTADRAGWVVITDASDATIGLMAIEPGRYQDVRVALDRRVLAPEALRAALHEDLGVAGTFERDADPALVEVSFSADADELTPAVEITVLNLGDLSWTFSAADPSRYAVTADPAAENPPIALRRGWRYQIFNPANVGHPFDLLEIGESGEDVVLLSQRLDGALDSDPSVAFEIVSPAFFRFTVSPALEERLEAYRCLIHARHMRGAASVAEP